MSNGAQLLAALPNELATKLPAINELVRVLVGDNGGPFNVDNVFFNGELNNDLMPPATGTNEIDGFAHAANISNAMQAAAIDPDLSATLNTLLDGVPGSDAVTSALNTAIDFIEEQLQNISDISGTAQERVDAFMDLNTPHAADTYGTAPYGYIPAIEGVINSIAGTSLDADAILAPLAAAAAVLQGGEAVTIFTSYSLGALQLLSRSRGG